MLHLFGGATETRPLPGRFLWSLPLLVLVLLFLAVQDAPNVHTPSFGNTTGEVAPVVVPQPVGQLFDTTQDKSTQQVPAVVAPMENLLTLRWEKYDWEKNPLGLGEYDRWGRDERGVYSADENGGGIPMGEFIGTGTARNAIVYIRDIRMITGSSETYPLEFSPDGEHWFRAANLPEVQGAQIRGAVWNGDDILILANDAYAPWEYKHYIARVTPQDTKGAPQ